MWVLVLNLITIFIGGITLGIVFSTEKEIKKLPKKKTISFSFWVSKDDELYINGKQIKQKENFKHIAIVLKEN